MKLHFPKLIKEAMGDLPKRDYKILLQNLTFLVNYV
jgi:Mg2+/Co2+ transporter CorC